MKRFLVLTVAASLVAAGAWAQAVPVIFDTDMGNDVDDALALAMLHALESRGECRLLGVTVTKDNPWAAVFVDLVNTFYGRGRIPVGMVKGGVTPEGSPMIQAPAERRRADGTLVYPRRLASGAEAPEAVGLLRRLLAAEKDGSVVLVQVGFSTNLARLLDAPSDVELVKRKVKLLSVMAGNFVEPKPEFNVQQDTASARKLFDRQTWDLTAVLDAVRPGGGYFELSAPGRITADDAGRTSFRAEAAGKHRYLVLPELWRARTLECMVGLASQPAR